jgi:hypothetical protein
MYRGLAFSVEITHKDKDGVVVSLAGYTPYAQVRRKAGAQTLTLDLEPAIVGDGSAGKTAIDWTDEETAAVQVHGDFFWDYILENPDGLVIGPFAGGKFTIADIVTKPA